MPTEQESPLKPMLGSELPQFATAEYSHGPQVDRCRICGKAIAGQYYRVNDQMACATCATQAKDGQPKDSHAAFLRALLLGAGASVLAMALYATFTIVTNLYIGYLALAVGWFVARVMMKASNGVGGRRYQIAAVLLTYAAISMAEVPIAIAQYIGHQKQVAAQKQQAAAANPFPDDKNGTAIQTPSKPAPRHTMSFVTALGGLFLIGLASPFLELQNPVHGLIGLVILFVGLQIAFQRTKATQLGVEGPYSALPE